LDEDSIWALGGAVLSFLEKKSIKFGQNAVHEGGRRAELCPSKMNHIQDEKS
jgi:hypothetical protein